ncbi:hypothetical protein H696_05621 [Fonticula alba]|uniref:J domain-containing protein n=1 Tax=Fonticula alba TaxID=691883 RepID=A0A058Z2Z6_FONAL|nr:hypothetical protein H696_05621 [Fonticula alba]KCV67892.1 hypothetical protein H696_05621 [Fonticula alba]|eukprot:XP_009497712.1 hypothetical protein H696_05621 [Fonticula alba]
MASSSSQITHGYYSFLGVPMDATDSEIREAYVQLSRLYHPDKVLDEDDKEVASEQFMRLHHVYQSASVQLLCAFDARPTTDKLSLFPSAFSDGTSVGRASPLRVGVLQIPGEVVEIMQALPAVTEQSLVMSVSGQLDRRNQLQVSSSVSLDLEKEHIDGRTVVATLAPVSSFGVNYIRHLTPRTSAVATVSFGTKASSRLVVTHRLRFGTRCSFGLTATTTHGALLFIPLANFEYAFSDRWTLLGSVYHQATLSAVYCDDTPPPGHVQVDDPESPDFFESQSVRTKLGPASEFSADLTTTGLSVSYRNRLDSLSDRPSARADSILGRSLLDIERFWLRAKASLTSDTVSMTLGLSYQLNRSWRFFTGLTLDASQGVLTEIRASSDRTRLAFPILLSSNPLSVMAISLGGLLPMAFGYLLKRFVIDPQAAALAREKLRNHRLRISDWTNAQRVAAMGAVRLLQAQAEEKRRQEASHKGLVILEAWYGRFEDGVPPGAGSGAAAAAAMGAGSGSSASSYLEQPLTFDVTIPLQFLVTASELHLQSTSKAGLSGFYDPCFGEPKKLFIRYLYRDREHRVVIDDGQSLSLPKRNHAVKESGSA